MPPVFEQVTFFYEVLLRFGDQKANRGQLTGAHLQTLTQTLMDGNVIATSDNGPKQLALLDGESGQKLSDVLGGVNAQTIIRNQTLVAALVAEQGRTSELTGDLNQAQAKVQELDSQITAANAEISRLKALIPNAALTIESEPGEPAQAI
jgi:uncharacterized small protein (DUF1192 family)